MLQPYSQTLDGWEGLVYCLWVKPGAYPRVDRLKGDSLRYAPALLLLGNIQLAREGIVYSIWVRQGAYP
jgi:hypothetical protein